MATLTVSAADEKRVKAMGFLSNKGTDNFNARIITVNGKITAEQQRCIAEAAEKETGVSYEVKATEDTVSITAVGKGAHASTPEEGVNALTGLLVLLSSLLSACVTAFAGPVSFVGTAVPQIVKSLFHTARPILMVPACFLGGSVFCLFCDLLARTLMAPTELSISTVTAIFGAPEIREAAQALLAASEKMVG